MNVIINIFGGYMESCSVYDNDRRAMLHLNQEPIIVDSDDLDIRAFNGFVEYQSVDSDSLTCFVTNFQSEIQHNAKQLTVVSSFRSWGLEVEKVKVFSSHVKAWKYYDSLRKLSNQYEKILREDGNNGNFLDDDTYAVFIESANYIREKE